jgi:hypothetical protein
MRNIVMVSNFLYPRDEQRLFANFDLQQGVNICRIGVEQLGSLLAKAGPAVCISMKREEVSAFFISILKGSRSCIPIVFLLVFHILRHGINNTSAKRDLHLLVCSDSFLGLRSTY